MGGVKVIVGEAEEIEDSELASAVRKREGAAGNLGIQRAEGRLWRLAAEMLITTARDASSSASVQGKNRTAHSSLRAISQLIYNTTWKLDILLA